MNRLRIDDIIKYYNNKAMLYEKACGVEYLKTAPLDTLITDYWKSLQVSNYLTLLKEYQRLENQHKLLRMPCRIGDVIYRLNVYKARRECDIESFTISNILICNDKDVLLKYDYDSGVICHLENLVTGSLYLDTYAIFYSKTEASLKLSEIVKSLSI
mgnify:FL=1